MLAGCSRHITLVTLNIANGAGRTSLEHRARQAAFLRGLHPDVVALQEVDWGVPRSGGADTAELALGTLVAAGEIIRGPTMALDGGSYGNALWVRDGLAGDRGVLALASDGTEEPRGAIWARVGSHLLVATHLSAYGPHPRDLRRQQLEQLAGLRADVVMGDLNARAEEVAPHLAPLASPGGAVDQIWTREGKSTLVPTEGASDHPFAALETLGK